MPLGDAEAVRSRPTASGFDTGMFSLALAVRESRLVLSWVDRVPLEPARLWLAVRVGAGALSVRAVGDFAVDEGQLWRVAASGAGQALFWTGAAAPIADDDRLLRGVRIGDDAAPRPSPAGSPDLDAERLQLTPIAGGTSTLFDAGVASTAGGFAAFAVGNAPLLPAFDSFPEPFLGLGQWSGSAPLAAGPAATQRFRIGLYPGTAWPGVPSNIGSRFHPIEFDGHWLLIGDDDFGAYATTVFR